MRFKILTILVVIEACVTLSGCSLWNRNNEQTDESDNIYKDATLQEIYQYRCMRDIPQLTLYLSNNFPEYRKAALAAMACIGDEMCIVPVAAMLNDKDEDVRTEASFALGRTGSPKAEKYLMSAWKSEQSIKVRASLLKSLGHCGGSESLEFISLLNIDKTEASLLEAQAESLCGFALRNMCTGPGTDCALKILCNTSIHENIRVPAAEYFRLCNLDISLYSDQLFDIFKKSSLISTRYSVVAAAGKIDNIKSAHFLERIIKSEEDYTVKLTAIESLEKLTCFDSDDLMNTLLTDEDERISLRAAMFLKDRGASISSDKYTELASTVDNWQARTILLAAALKNASDKETISQGIISGYEVTENIQEKAALLKALAGNPEKYRFVENIALYNDNDYLKVVGLETLAEMRKSPVFDSVAGKVNKETGENMYREFAITFKKSLQSGISEITGFAAECIADSSYDFVRHYTNTYFLKQALNNCTLPKDEDTYRILANAIYKITGEEIPDPPAISDNIINWKQIMSVNQGQRVKINTDKGDIIIQTDVNNAPLAVSDFIGLIKKEYFNQTFFNCATGGLTIENHGVYGGFDQDLRYVIPAEIGPQQFDEGTVAMESSSFGNTYTTGWFIVTAAQTDLNSRYTVIGSVVEGMDCVKKLQTGDKVLSVSIL